MIVAKLTESGHPIATGSCHIKGYDTGGWFPIESFTFGFDPDKGKKSRAGKGQGVGAVGSQNGAMNVRSQASLNGSASTTNNQSLETTVSLAKQIDTATCDLMFLSMRDQEKKTGDESFIKADIHVLSSVKITRPGSTAAHVFPNLMIHLAGVLVKQWNVQGNGDDRPTEDVTLLYDRSAIQYVHTKDGKLFMPHRARGWDQTKHLPFEFDFSKYVDCLPSPAG
jgi:hypothetical protein